MDGRQEARRRNNTRQHEAGMCRHEQTLSSFDPSHARYRLEVESLSVM